MKKFLGSALFGVILAEPSAFQLQSGATKNEINSLQNRNKDLQKTVVTLQNQVNSTERNQDGLKSIIEGQNLLNKRHQDLINAMGQNISELQNNVNFLRERLKTTDENAKKLEAELIAQSARITKLQDNFQEMSRTITESNASIVQQLNLISQFLETRQKDPETPAGPKKDEKPAPKKPVFKADPKKSDKDYFAEAKELIRKKDYDRAEEIFRHVAKNGYKAAEAHYELGGIFYRKKDYAQAILNYKKAATLDENAPYMPILLWRTAWSFRYQKDEKNFQKFIDIIISDYPNSEQGKKAAQDREVEARGREKAKKT